MKSKILIIFILTFVFTLSFAKSDSTKQANKILDKLRKDLNALVADFEQYEIDANDNQSEKSTGKVWLKAPNQFKWQYQQPLPQLIVASGQQVWIYDEDLEQVTIKQQRNKQNPIYVLLNKEKTDKNFIVSLSEETSKANKNALQWVVMTPKKPSEDVKKVWLGIKDNNLNILKLQNQLDNIVVFKFNNIKKNPELDKNFFSFDIPKGTDIIRDGPTIGEF